MKKQHFTISYIDGQQTRICSEKSIQDFISLNNIEGGPAAADLLSGMVERQGFAEVVTSQGTVGIYSQNFKTF